MREGPAGGPKPRQIEGNMQKSTALKMLAALEALRMAENAASGGKSLDDYEYRHTCSMIAEMAGFRSRVEWIDILNGIAELVDN